MSLKSIYKAEVQAELDLSQFTQRISGAGDFSGLPEAMRKYLDHCGYTNRELAYNFAMQYGEAFIKLKPDQNWTSLQCHQFNSCIHPTRVALMESKMYGVLPFTGRDKYQHGQGNMLIKMAGVTVSEAKGAEMDQSALVTYLAETCLLPYAFLMNNMRWEQPEPGKLSVTMEDEGMSVSGSFIFNSRHEIVEFRTSDRYYAVSEKEYRQVEWSALLGNYRTMNGLRVPTELRAVWHLPEGDYEYFKCRITGMKYNITDLKQLEV